MTTARAIVPHNIDSTKVSGVGGLALAIGFSFRQGKSWDRGGCGEEAR
jgi:hypothetical protein